MNFLQVGRISLLSVAENIMTCLWWGVDLKISCTSRRMSAKPHLGRVECSSRVVERIASSGERRERKQCEQSDHVKRVTRGLDAAGCILLPLSCAPLLLPLLLFSLSLSLSTGGRVTTAKCWSREAACRCHSQRAKGVDDERHVSPRRLSPRRKFESHDANHREGMSP